MEHNSSFEYPVNRLTFEESNLAVAFGGHGRIWTEFEVVLTLTAEEFFTKLQSIFTLESIDDWGVYSLPHGGLRVKDLGIIDGNQGVSIKGMLNPNSVRRLETLVESHTHITSKVQGVHDIDIYHQYLDFTKSAGGEHKAIHHAKDTKDFEYLIPEMYPRLDVVEMMRQYSNSKESIMILSGEPGTGKTCVAKMMMHAHAMEQGHDIKVIYVKDRELLRRDNFWANLGNVNPDMIILDDLDSELIPRTVDNPNEIISNMLSYSDGIFDVDTKILITTNLTDSKIDKALVRPGRTFDALCLPALSKVEAKSIWVNVLKAPEDEYTRRFKDLTDISQAALISEYERFNKSGSPSYLRDPSISVRKLVEEGGKL